MDTSANREQQLFLIMGGVILALIVGVAIFDLLAKSGGGDLAFEEPKPVVKQAEQQTVPNKKQDWVDAMAPAPVFQAASTAGVVSTGVASAPANAATPPSPVPASAPAAPAAPVNKSPAPTSGILPTSPEGSTPPAALALPQTAAKPEYAKIGDTQVAIESDPLPDEKVVDVPSASAQPSLDTWLPNAASLEAMRHAPDANEADGVAASAAAVEKNQPSVAKQESVVPEFVVTPPVVAVLPEESEQAREYRLSSGVVSRAFTTGLGQTHHSGYEAGKLPPQPPLIGLKNASRLAVAPVIVNKKPAVQKPVLVATQEWRPVASGQAVPAQSFSKPLRTLPVAPVASAPAASEEEKERGEFWVKLATFSNEANAQLLSQTVSSLYLDGQSLPVVRNDFVHEGKPYYRVRVGPFADRQWAERVLLLVQQHVNINGTVVTAKK
ncbi:MAG: SPOR domain-containing protein [Magnetococcales bacterium]|nr:SPOR domain-containing protein [Magnetococcales bacterium]MBF0115465.1 SPOR domain-containing protein [Magnetococcales bacterium]